MYKSETKTSTEATTIYTIGGLLIKGLLKENHSTEVLKSTGSGEEELAEGPPI